MKALDTYIFLPCALEFRRRSLSNSTIIIKERRSVIMNSAVRAFLILCGFKKYFHLLQDRCHFFRDASPIHPGPMSLTAQRILAYITCSEIRAATKLRVVSNLRSRIRMLPYSSEYFSDVVISGPMSTFPLGSHVTCTDSEHIKQKWFLSTLTRQ